MNAKEIKENRKKLGLTQKELANLVGVSTQTINGYENGKEIPSTKHQILDKILNQKTDIINEPSETYFTISGYDKKINQIKTLISERMENLKYLPKNHPDRNHILEIIKIYEERIRFIEIGKKEAEQNK